MVDWFFGGRFGGFVLQRWVLGCSGCWLAGCFARVLGFVVADVGGRFVMLGPQLRVLGCSGC